VADFKPKAIKQLRIKNGKREKKPSGSSLKLLSIVKDKAIEALI